MALTDIKIKALNLGIKLDGTATSKAYRVTDEKGLYLEVKPTGSKLWRFKYRFDGEQKRLSLNTYLDDGLKEARNGRDDHRKQTVGGLYIRQELGGLKHL